MKQVLAPIAAKFSLLMERMIAEKDENRQMAYAQSINNAMALARCVYIFVHMHKLYCLVL